MLSGSLLEGRRLTFAAVGGTVTRIGGRQNICSVSKYLPNRAGYRLTPVHFALEGDTLSIAFGAGMREASKGVGYSEVFDLCLL